MPTVGVVPSPFDRLVRPDRPVSSVLLIVGVGAVASLVAGVVVGLLAESFAGAFGTTVAVGMLVTAVVAVAVLAVAASRR